MEDEFNFSEQALHAELANTAYRSNFDDDEKATSGSPPLDQSIHDRFEVETHYADQGDVVYSFTDRSSEDMYVVGRGADDTPGDPGYTENSQLDDWGQYPGIGLGTGTTLGRQMADVATDIYEATGQRVTTAGHFYRGHGAQEAAIWAPDAIKQATNVQSPSTVELAGTNITALGAQSLHNHFDWAPSVQVNRITASFYEANAMGAVQRLLDNVGDAIRLPNAIAIPVGEHSAAEVHQYHLSGGRSVYQTPPVYVEDDGVPDGTPTTGHGTNAVYHNDDNTGLRV